LVRIITAIPLIPQELRRPAKPEPGIRGREGILILILIPRKEGTKPLLSPKVVSVVARHVKL
jgi:hypothetical protein